jgi:hypothetical protein
MICGGAVLGGRLARGLEDPSDRSNPRALQSYGA